jgi:hypothetical protein
MVREVRVVAKLKVSAQSDCNRVREGTRITRRRSRATCPTEGTIGTEAEQRGE